MQLETPRLQLAPLRPQDLPLVHVLHSFPETMQYNTLGIPESVAVTEQVFEPYFASLAQAERTQYIWIIRDQASNFIGTIGITVGLARYRKADLFYNIAPTQ
ncbi:MAG: GNAT family N-acetyltransferase, partial [Bacteroidota bacterium]